MRQPFVSRTLSLVLFLFCSIFFSPDHLDARISFGQIKGLGGVIKPEYQHLCPLYGALLWETEYVKNLWRFTKTEGSDDYQPSTKLLLKQLFFFQHDGVTFSPTANPQYPAFHLGVQEISRIIGLLELFHSPENRKTLPAKLTDVFSPLFTQVNVSGEKIQALEEKIEKINGEIKKLDPATKSNEKRIKGKTKELEKLRKEVEILKKGTAQGATEERLNPVAQQASLDFLNKVINRDKESLVTVKPDSSEHNDLTTKIKANQSLQNKPVELAKKMHNSINLLIECLCKALDEENTLYPPNHTIAIVLALLWAKAENKTDFIRYFDIIADQLGSTKYFTLDQVDFTENEEKMKAFTSAAYTARDYDELFESAGNTTSIDDFEALTFFYLGFKAFKSPLPPKIDMKGGVKYDNLEFSDCGEQTLLSLFLALFYDAGTRTVKIDSLNTLKAASPLIKFFQEHQTIEKLTDNMALHVAWAQVVSGLNNPPVTYQSGNPPVCDIKPGLNNFGINNMLSVLENLLPGAKASIDPEKPSFDGLIRALKKVDIALDIDMPEANTPREQVVTLKIQKANTPSPLILTWHFQPDHFVLLYNDTSKDYPQTYAGRLKEQLEKLTKKSTPQDLAMYTTIAGALKLNLPEILDQKFRQYAFLMQPFTSAKIVESFEIIKSLWPNEKQAQVISNFYTEISTELTDPAQGNFIKKVCQPSEFPTSPIWLKIKDKLSDSGKLALCLTVINDPALYKNWIETTGTMMTKLNDEQSRFLLIGFILNKLSLDSNFDQAEFKDKDLFLKTLLDWLETTLPAITTTKYQTELLAIIVGVDPRNFKSHEKLLQQLFGFVEKALPKITDPENQLNLIKQILNIKPAYFQRYENLLNPLFDWAKDTLPNISDLNKQFVLIDRILDNTMLTSFQGYENLLQPLFEGVKITLPKISNHQIQINLIDKILHTNPAYFQGHEDLLKPLYNGIKATLPNILNPQIQSDFIVMILGIKLIRFLGHEDLLQPLFDWVKATLPKISDDRNQSLLIQKILKINPTKYKGYENLLRPLYEAIKTTLPNLPEKTQSKLRTTIQQSSNEQLKAIVTEQ